MISRSTPRDAPESSILTPSPSSTRTLVLAFGLGALAPLAALAAVLVLANDFATAILLYGPLELGGAGLAGWLGGRREPARPWSPGAAAAAGALLVDQGMALADFSVGMAIWGVPGAVVLVGVPVAGAYVGALGVTTRPGSHRRPR